MPTETTNKIVYFAYGSNMLSRRLCERTPSATKLGVGFLKKYRLTFDKVSKDCSGKCDMNYTGLETDRVYGVIFEIDPSEKRKLDSAEGLGKGYEEKNVTVILMEQVEREIDALAYIATNKNPILKPYDWYKAFVVAGAVEHKLPESYIEWLRSVHSKPDHDSERYSRNEALLFQG